MIADLPHLNEFERKQIERALARRTRYRYVRPTLRLTPDGILIESPCCSRRVDAAGGTVDIALLQRAKSGAWRLYRRDHAAAKWKLHGPHERLSGLLDALIDDPDRLFWQ
jgi:hypothetical protein